MTDDLAITEYIVHTIAETAIANEAYFCELDSVVGDGDFGYSLARGFEKLLEQWDDLDRKDVATFLQKVAMVLTSRIGGSSGPIWGTAFMRASMVARKADKLDGSTVVAMFRSAIEGIKARGGAELGDKTLLDVLSPMADEIEAKVNSGAQLSEILSATSSRANEAAEATKTMQAKRGRASYTGERSVGSIDAGAKGVAVLTEAVVKNWPTA